jgi:hypothetical protein
MTTTHDAWSLQKRRPAGWEYLILRTDGVEVGSYSGRRWLPGGTILLHDGTRAELRTSLLKTSSVRLTDTRQKCFDVRKSRSRGAVTLALTILFDPAEATDAVLLVLTACTVVLLEEAVPTVQVPGSGG